MRSTPLSRRQMEQISTFTSQSDALCHLDEPLSTCQERFVTAVDRLNGLLEAGGHSFLVHFALSDVLEAQCSIKYEQCARYFRDLTATWASA